MVLVLVVFHSRCPGLQLQIPGHTPKLSLCLQTLYLCPTGHLADKDGDWHEHFIVEAVVEKAGGARRECEGEGEVVLYVSDLSPDGVESCVDCGSSRSGGEIKGGDGEAAVSAEHAKKREVVDGRVGGFEIRACEAWKDEVVVH